MKKFLALVLALVMTMSLVTISAGADFTDDSSITYGEAVDVMTAIGVVGGYADGSFNPTGTLTRGAAAKIICNMILGPTEAGALATVEAPFADVPADHVFAGYIAYCVSEGIVSGYSDGTFRPAGTLTGYAFWKMLLGALGYDAVAEGYTGANYAINVAKRGLNIGLDAGLKGAFSGGKALTREEACLYALNTLKATMVEYDNNSSITIGDIVISNSTKAEEVKRTETTAGTNYAGDATTAAGYGYLQFCEQYFKKLKSVTGTADDFGRPASHKWQNDSKDVVNVVKTATYVYTADMNNTDGKKAIKADLEAKNITLTASGSDYTFTAPATTNVTGGLTVGSVDALAALTDNGKVVEVFISNGAITNIVTITYTVGKVTTLAETNKTANGSVYTTYKVTPMEGSTESAGYRVYTVAADKEKDSAIISGDIAKKDVVTYVVANSKLYIYATESFQGTQSAKNASKETITVDGELYTVANGVVNDGGAISAAADFANSKTAANYYVDQFGYVVYTDAIAAETQYAVINGIVKISTLTDTVKAELVFADGTTKEVEIAELKDASGTAITLSGLSTTKATNSAYENEIYTFSVKDDGKYKLAMVENTTKSAAKYTTSAAETITTNGTPAVAGVVAGNGTTFVVRTVASDNSVSYKVYEGFKAVPTIASTSTAAVTVDYAKNADGAVEFVYINCAKGASSTAGTETGDVIYVLDTNYTTILDGDDTYYVYNGVVNGEVKTFTASENDYAADALYVITTNASGIVTGKTLQTGAVGGNVKFLLKDNDSVAVADAKDGVLTVDGVNYTYDGSETVYTIDVDDAVATSSVDAVKDSTTAKLWIKLVSGTTTNEIDTLYVQLKNQA